MLLNEKPLNFTIFKNTKLEGAISGPNRAPILRAQIWARSGRAFHYWSGARQITLLEPHFSRSGPDRRPTKISARVSLLTVLNFVSLSQVCFTIFPTDENIEQRICLKWNFVCRIAENVIEGPV